MKKIFTWVGENILLLSSLFLLAFIPLYPKLPLFDIQHTWVYVRLEDFVVAFIILLWISLVLLRKVTLKTPLTFPIMIFWIVGGIATLHGVLLVFSTLFGVHANVALLSYLRRIEYMSLFFVAYTGVKDKRSIYYVIGLLAVVLLLIVGYGFGQRFLGFPAYLTMNEEFAKGIPIQLSALSRISSTFAGHYDLAAYLVLVIPILTSMVFGFKNKFIKIFLLATSLLGFILLFMTVSRVSVFVLLLSLGMVLFFQKKRLVIASLLVVLFMLLTFSPRLLQRFENTVSEVEVLVDAKTGVAIGPVKEVPPAFFTDTIIKIENQNQGSQSATTAAILSHTRIPQQAALVVEANRSTGEDLVQGTSYINLPLSPVKKKVALYFFEKVNNVATKEAGVYFGDYVIKKAKAYDLSFTTRFQGEWPRTIEAFQKNVLLGSGYGSVSLAVDNNYLRILGESGLLGLLSFISIFIFAGIYIKNILPKVDSPIMKNFVLGFIAGTFGLALNATLIDVFEASKIAFSYWILMGITLGLLHLYNKDDNDLFKEFKKVVTSVPAIIVYLLIFTVGLFSTMYSYYFVANDFSWLKHATSCYGGQLSSLQGCPLTLQTIFGYFVQTGDSFYRPATQLYFYFMHIFFWLNQTMYHSASILLYFATAALVLIIAGKILKNYLLAAVSAGVFLILVGHSEVVFWISSIDILFTAFFALIGLLSFIYWEEKKNVIFLIVSILATLISPFFHESGVILPLLIILYDVVFGSKVFVNKETRTKYILLFTLPICLYIILWFIVLGHAFVGNYTWLALPSQSVLTVFGYIGLALLGPAVISPFQGVLDLASQQILFATAVAVGLVLGVVIIYKGVIKKMPQEEKKVIIFAFTFFLIALLPFLGINSLVSSYGYLPNVGLVILFSFFLKKMYEHIRISNEKWTSLLCIIVVSIVFCMLQLFQLQAVQGDWLSASEKSERFLVSLSEHYSDEWKQDKWKFYFINVPVKQGYAWIFPTGLSDAIWFVTQNPQTTVLEGRDLTLALDFADGNSNTRVFEFQVDGSIKEVIRMKVQGKTTIYKK